MDKLDQILKNQEHLKNEVSEIKSKNDYIHQEFTSDSSVGRKGIAEKANQAYDFSKKAKWVLGVIGTFWATIFGWVATHWDKFVHKIFD